MLWRSTFAACAFTQQQHLKDRDAIEAAPARSYLFASGTAVITGDARI